MNDNLSDYTDDERRAFEALPRTVTLDHEMEDRVVAVLRRRGLLRSRAGQLWRIGGVLLAAGLVAAAWFGGVHHGARAAHGASIEGQLERSDLSSAERILLMQRAGSAYVAAANGYAASVARTDSTAVEVSSQVLMGAARAVARTGLDGTLAPRLASVLQAPRGTPASHSVIWY